MNKNNGQISMPVIRRLPRYYRCLLNLEQNHTEKVSSKTLSELLGFTASQVRQDLNCFGGFGQQGCGYSVALLKAKIEELLGIDKSKKVIIYGVGNLGRAIMCHFDFEKYGFEVSGLFDKNPELISTFLRGIEIRDDATVVDFIKDNPVDVAFLCIPTIGAQSVVERLYSAGVRTFWNFSHFDIRANYPDCTVENVHLSESLMILSYLMSNKDTEE